MPEQQPREHLLPTPCIPNGAHPNRHTPEIIRRANPYHLPEEMKRDDIRKYYTKLPDFSSSPILPGWMQIEMGLSRDGLARNLRRGAELMAQTMDTRSNDPASYSDAALALACMPFYEDRASGEPPSSASIDTVERNMTEVLSDPRILDGERALAATMLLSVRASRLTGNPEDIIYPSSARQGRNAFRDPHGKRLNHDGHRISDGRSHPIEFKLGGTTQCGSAYAPDIFLASVAGMVRAVINTGRLYPDIAAGQQHVDGTKPSGRELLQTFIAALTDPESHRSHIQLSDGVTAKLYERLRRHQEKYPYPGTLHRFSSPPVPAAQPSREQIVALGRLSGTNISTGSVAAQILAHREEFIPPGLLAAPAQIGTALESLRRIFEGSSSPAAAQSLEELARAEGQILAALGSLAAAYRGFGSHVRQITGNK